MFDCDVSKLRVPGRFCRSSFDGATNVYRGRQDFELLSGMYENMLEFLNLALCSVSLSRFVPSTMWRKIK